MKLKKYLLIGIPVVAVVLELLPNGAVLNFANPEGDCYRYAYPYFSLTPFGYANFGPFLTSLLTCALLVLAVIHGWKQSRRLDTAIRIVSIAAVVTSLMPLLFGLRSFTVIGAAISVLLLLELAVSFLDVSFG